MLLTLTQLALFKFKYFNFSLIITSGWVWFKFLGINIFIVLSTKLITMHHDYEYTNIN